MKFVSYVVITLLLLSGACSAQSTAELQDARVIENLVAAGSDISKPHEIDFFMFLPDKSRAEAAAIDIRQLGYIIVSIDQSPGQSRWQIHATRRMAPQLGAMNAVTRTLEEVASRHGGDYDGWGTAVIK